ncbi:MAG: divalent metal cation transporter [bacterium]|nr:divalent metal cation transporter [bacterium]
MWSVIAGAFIGPGTVTTAASAGAGFGLSLLWTLAFSTVACLLLQEASARVTILSGCELGALLRRRSREGWRRQAMLILILGAIVLGCAAYQAGNLLGAVVGAERLTGLSPALLTLAIGAGAALLLWLGTSRVIASVFSMLVAVMGFAFLLTAIRLQPSIGEIIHSALVPSTPQGSGLLVIGLIGTTVVPYNLFLGSGLARGQSLKQVRFGLPVAIILGGVISGAILIVGSAVSEQFSYDGLAAVLDERLGGWAQILFGVGLFAAGFTSAISAPWAAALTTRSLFASSSDSKAWGTTGWRYRVVWASVLASGMVFGIIGVSPIPAIVLAQALNGVLLPVVAIFLLIVVNDRKAVGLDGLGSWLNTTLLMITVWITVLLGVTNVARAAVRVVGTDLPTESTLLLIAAIVATAAFVPVAKAVVKGRRGEC